MIKPKNSELSGQQALSEDQNRVKKELLGSQKGISTFFDNAQMAIGVVTLAGKVLAANASLEKLLGYSPNEMLLLNSKVIYANLHDREQLLQDLQKNDTLHASGIQFKRKDGSLVTVNLSLTCFVLHSRKVILAHIEEVPSRQRVEWLQNVQKELITRLGTSNDLAQALNCVLETALQLDEVDCGGIYRVDPPTQTLQLINFIGVAPAFAAAVASIPPGAIVGQLVSKGQPFLAPMDPNLLTSAPVFQAEKIRATLALPIQHGQQIGSVLVLASHHHNSFSTETRQTLETILIHVRGVLERIESETALLLSEKRFRTLAAISPDGIFYTDSQGKGLYFNERWSEIHGMPVASALGDGWQNTIHPEDKDFIRTALQHLLHEGQPLKLEYRIRSDGAFRWVYGQAVPEKDKSGCVMGYVGTVSDITERKIAEEELRFNNTLLTTQLETAQHGILMVGPQRQILRYNQRFVELWQIPEQVLASKSDQLAIQVILDKLVDPAAFLRLVEALYVDRLQTSRDELRLVDGRIFDRFSSPILAKDGTYYGRIWYFQDVTQRKQAEAEIKQLNQELEQHVLRRTHELAKANLALMEKVDELQKAQETLRQSETQYRVVADNTYAWEYWMDPNRNFVYISPSCEWVCGYTAEEFIQTPALFINIVHPADRPLFIEHYYEKENHHKETLYLEYRFIRKDGMVRWMGHICQSAYTPEGLYLGRRGSNQDITERKQTEEKLNRQAQRAEALVHTAARLNSHLDLKELLNAICEEAAFVLNAPITSVFLYNEQSQLFEYTADYGFSGEISSKLKPWAPGQINNRQITTPQIIIHSEEDLKQLPNKHLLQQAGICSAVRGLMVHQDQPIGFLSLYYLDKSQLEFAKEDSELLSGLADQATQAIINARLSEQIKEMMQNLENRVAERTHELATLYDISTIANQASGQQSFLENALKIILDTFHCQNGMILLTQPTHQDNANRPTLSVYRGLSDRAAQMLGQSIINQSQVFDWIQNQGQVLFINELRNDPRLNLPAQALPLLSQYNLDSFLGTPLRLSGECVGVMGVFGGTKRRFSVYEISMITNLADQVGLGIGTIRLQEHTKHALISGERTRLARELHDSATQLLYSLSLMAETAARLGSVGKHAEAQKYLQQVSDISQQALKEMRRMIYEMQPLTLFEAGIVNAIQQRLETVEQRLGVETHLVVEDPGQMLANGWFADSMLEDIFRITIEALNNTLKHAASLQVDVQLVCHSQQIEVKIIDYGKGFEVNTPHRGIGLKTMQERAARLGGNLIISSTPAKGSQIHLIIPITETT